ncbi:MAG: glutamate-1-semialdehyde 2,1-aminomutase [Planctomycetes bacterium]|nr:glutamate-1-semialdehyde 2,1-aminomutase [Planctomycetota bacterium]
MVRNLEKSRAAFERACHVLVGGVNSPVRAFNAVGGTPPVIASAAGARLTDIDDNEYIDYVGSYGPLIHGHAQEQVVTAITKATRRGTTYGAPTEAETKLAELILAAYPTAEMVRFVYSGTEACMSALRLVRAVTRRNKIIKCIGCYHGHSDCLLVQPDTSATTSTSPSSRGVPPAATADTLLVPYNDVKAAKRAFDEHGADVAGMILEPVCGNMGVVLPVKGYLQALRELCDSHKALLIFDEVITGFRLAFGGAQEVFGVQPDITTLGKIIGGGLPVGAYLGSAKIMSQLAPLGDVYQAGTLSGNPLAMAAGLATLEPLRDGAAYGRLEGLGAAMVEEMAEAADKAKLGDRICIQRAGSMLTVFFTAGAVTDYASAAKSNLHAYAAFFHAMLDAGIYLPPSQFEAWFISLAHTQNDITITAEAAVGAFRAAAKAMQ